MEMRIEPPRSELQLGDSSNLPLSEQLWGIEWDTILPFALGDGVETVRGEYQDLRHFTAQHFENLYEIFEQPDIHVRESVGPARERFYDRCADIFLFRKSGRTIGTFTGNPLDWSTYYLRNCTVLREYQGHGFQAKYLKVVLELLQKAGVARAELDVSPSNLGQIQTFTRMRFNITGVTVSERWGTLLRFTKFLQADCELRFLDNFCFGVKYQAKTKKKG